MNVGASFEKSSSWREPQDDVVQVVKPKNAKDIEEELAGDDSEGKNWRGIMIALLVIVVICGMVIIAVVLVTDRKTEEDIGVPFTFEDLFSPQFKVKKLLTTWIGATDRNIFVHRLANGDIYQEDADTNESRLIMDDAVLKNFKTDHYLVSPDLNYVLIGYDIEPIYHHSFKAKYTIYNRHSHNSNNQLIAFPLDLNAEWESRKLQYAGWSPHGHSLTFVYDNNLYYQSNPFTTPARVTDNKQSRYILNGIPDWLYEEEILRSNVAHWLSADSRYVAYIQFNDTSVPLQTYPVFGDPTNIYGGMQAISYPKAGDLRPGINPTVRLYVAETANVKGSHRLISPPLELQTKEHYITMVQWRDNTHILVAWSNRAQNKTIVTVCHVVSTDCRENLVEMQNQGRGWVVVENVNFIRNGQQYLTILPTEIGDDGYWKHVAVVPATMDSDSNKIFITYGRWDVMEIVGYCEEDLTVYYISTNGDPRQRHLFRLKLTSDSDLRRSHHHHHPECITCEGPCKFVSAKFSPSGLYYIEGCLGPDVPQYSLKSTKHNKVRMLEDNGELKARLAGKALPRKEYFEFLTDDGETIWGQIYLPPILKKEHITLYPLLIYSYAGPDSQLVTDEFKLDWSTYLGSSENVIYASIDGRGSSARGNDFLHQVYYKLGTIEVQDQIDGTSYLKKQLQFVDKDRIAIWGWSYGGFVVSHVLGEKDDTTFRCGIAVAPVTDWRYYDTAYTERYMGMATSNDNYKGYDNANVSSKAPYFKGKGFLLVHGTADGEKYFMMKYQEIVSLCIPRNGKTQDNVHFQHSAQLMKALTEAGVTYQSQVYPDKNHQLPGQTTLRHLYRTMTRFLQKECWAGGKPQDAKPHVAEPNQKQGKGKS